MPKYDNKFIGWRYTYSMEGIGSYDQARISHSPFGKGTSYFVLCDP